MLKKSIVTILIGIISLINFIAIGTLILYVTNSSRQVTLKMEEASMLQMANYITDTIEDSFNNSIRLARITAARANVVLGIEENDIEKLYDICKKMSLISGKTYSLMYIFDTKGKIITGSMANGDRVPAKDRSDKEYVQKILQGQELFISPTVTKSSTTGEWISNITFGIKNKQGKIIGGMSFFPNMTTLFTEKLSNLRFGKSGYAFLLDNTGKAISHPDPEFMLKDTSTTTYGKFALNNQSGSTNYKIDGIHKFLVTTTIPTTKWNLCLVANHSEMAEGAIKQRDILIIIGSVIIILTILVIAILSRRLVFNPIKRISKFTDEIAAENYQAELKGLFSYEMADLANNIKAMVAEIKNKIGFSEGTLNAITMPFVVVDKNDKILQINQSIIDILHYTGKPQDYLGMHLSEFAYGDKNRKTITYRAIEEKKSLRNIQGTIPTQAGNEVDVLIDTSPIYDLDGNLLAGFAIFNDLTEIKAQQRKIETQNEKIAATAQEAFSVADQMAGAAEELSAQVEQSSKGTDIQRERVSETVTSMEEMNSTVLEVARNASGAAEVSNNAKEKAEEGQIIVKNTMQAIKQVESQSLALKNNMEQLGHQAEEIGTVMNVIADIADQTNLLALNAAIEAARAGEYGRGFAVVADEVRKLAEKTMTATKEVGTAIENIQTGTRGAVKNMEDSVASVEEATKLSESSERALEEIVHLIESSSDQVRSIATASEEQSASSEEINMAIGEINRISTETAEAMEQSAQAVADLAQLAQKLNHLISDLQNA